MSIISHSDHCDDPFVDEMTRLRDLGHQGGTEQCAQENNISDEGVTVGH